MLNSCLFHEFSLKEIPFYAPNMPLAMRGHMVTQKDTMPNILADRLQST